MKNRQSAHYVNRSSLTLHSREAIEICEGKKVSLSNGKIFKIPGVYAFGISVNSIWTHTLNDDPFAEYTLINIEEKIKRTFKKIDQYEALLARKKAKWQSPEGLCIEICESSQIHTISFNEQVFRTTHVKLLLLLIAKFDLLMRTLWTYRQFDIIKNARFKSMKRRSIRYIRATMQEARLYKPTGVTRNDILTETSLGQEIVEKHGMLPLSILKREQRAEYGPSPRC